MEPRPPAPRADALNHYAMRGVLLMGWQGGSHVQVCVCVCVCGGGGGEELSVRVEGKRLIWVSIRAYPLAI